MSNPTPVDDVVVTGQRRNNRFEPFPRGMMVPVPPPPGQHAEKPMLESAETIQCALLPNRRAWNSDAAAARAVGQMLSYAQSAGTNFFQNEHGAFLMRTGNLYHLGNITHGGPAEVTLDPTGVTLDNWAGDIHTHPSGNELPSLADWFSFHQMILQAEAAGRTDIDNIYYYVVARDDLAANGYRIYAYNRQWDGTTRGPEVDPEGTDCPT